ncbi:phosphatase [Streptomyces dangxiongensis]|uniref:Phosphatase n=1 Tax=Streptomyces dangxiongensis TaxID=1442032 RepID=A0A3G2J6K2_9ACTN|nr:SpoIIE family protein phosphatase [Streptomyces dangxiongensis]AYN37828.1 phosphatase [Streptomyces dangxiongensis]
MTATPDVWKIASVGDAARARAAVDRVATAGGAPALDRARLLTSLTARLRRCLDQGGTWELRLHARPTAAAGEGRLEVSLRPADSPVPDPDVESALACALPHRPAPDGPAVDRTLPEALLRADENTAAVLEVLDEQERLVRLHLEELHQTNQGVLALHSDLEAAVLAQRELLEAERTARAEAERARRLLTFLGDASAAITASLSHTAILRRLSGMLVPEYAEHLDVWLFDEEDAEQQEYGADAQHLRERPAVAVAAARTGRPQHAAAHAGKLPGTDDLPSSAPPPRRPVLAIPLVAHRQLGVLTLTAPGPRFDADTTVMLVELARRVGVALDNARRYEQYRDTAETLQHAQLTDLPTVPGLLLAARYLPATRGLNIGGDWYDAFLQPDGSLLAVIGDVTGHGLHAAVVMGQLRTALRAYAVENDSPGDILTHLHRMLRHLQPELYATAMIARFRPGEPGVVWASAGHPPAVVRDADGTVRVLNAKPGVMLGIPVPYAYADQRADLPAGSSLVLYTDGLVERRAQGIDPGIERLGRALGTLTTAELGQHLDAAADALLKPLLHDSERDDDVCVLMCHTMTPAGGEPRWEGDGGPSPTRRPGGGSPRGSVEDTRREGGCRESF